MFENLATAVIFNLDHCVSIFPLSFCRFLFNKPVLQLNDFFLKIISSISTENIFTGLGSPFRQIFVILIYTLLIYFLYAVLKKKLKIKTISLKKSIFISIFVSSILIGIFTRFYKLDQIPSGLTIDEVSIGYNALAINKTLKDQYGNFLPLTHFESLGDFKLPFTFYTVSLSQNILQNKIAAIRIPSAIAGVLLILVTFYLGKTLFNSQVGLFAAFLMSISSWNIYHSHIGLETNLGLLFSTVSILFLMKSLKSSIYLIFSGIFFGLAIYTHHSFWIFLPAIIFLFFLIYRKNIKIDKFFIISLSVIILSVIPFALERNNFRTSRFNETVFSGVKNYNMTTQVLNQYIRSFSFITWYSPSGFDIVDVDANHGLFYIFELPLLILGILLLIAEKNKRSLFLLGWLFVYPLPLIITKDISAARMYQLLPLPQIIESLALIYLFKRKNILIVPFFLLAAFSLVRFLTDMWSVSPFLYSRYTNYGDLAIINYIKDKNKNFYIEQPLFDELYLKYFYGALPSKEKKIKDSRGVLVYSYKNINIVERGYLPGNNPNNVLISFPQDLPLNYKKTGEIILIDKSDYATISSPK